MKVTDQVREQNLACAGGVCMGRQQGGSYGSTIRLHELL